MWAPSHRFPGSPADLKPGLSRAWVSAPPGLHLLGQLGGHISQPPPLWELWLS